MKHSIKVVFFLGIVAIFFNSCVNKIQYSEIPYIEFVGFSVVKAHNDTDSLGYVTISYTDGDGDLGFLSSDTNNLTYDFFIKLFQLKNGNDVELLPPDSTFTLNARLPYLTPEGDNKNIKGEITMLLELYFITPVLISDTVAFEIFITDRARNQSNVVKSPYYVLAR